VVSINENLGRSLFIWSVKYHQTTCTSSRAHPKKSDEENPRSRTRKAKANQSCIIILAHLWWIGLDPFGRYFLSSGRFLNNVSLELLLTKKIQATNLVKQTKLWVVRTLNYYHFISPA